jgi:RHS repeat-associated protein
MNTMTTTFGANNDEVTYFTNKQDYFCNHNLKYLVSGYLQYLSVLGITSTSDPRYIAIDTFGATGLNYGYESYGTVIAAYHNYLITPHEGETLNWRDFVSDYLSHHPEICPPAPMAPTQSIPVPFPTQTTCQQFSLNVSETYNDDNYQAYLNSKKQAFKTEYLRQALEKVNETFTMSYTDREYQYTLYYYDQAGNLMQTVAPQGVTIVPSSYNQEIDQVRIDNEVAFLNNSLLPFNQKFQTKYRYNSLNQLVWQSTPDGGETRFAYDELGRIVASQNSKQGNLATLAKTSFELSPYIGTKENVIYNVGKNIPIKEAYGISKETIADYGTISYSVPSSVNSLEYNSLCNVILGLTYKKENLGQIYYGFIHDCQGNVSIKTLETISEIIPVAEGNVLYITREDGYIRFFKDEQLLKEVVEESYGKLMYVNFYLPQAKTSISNINIGYTKPGRDFSYTCYDPLGRINEAGQFTARQTLRINDDGKLVYNNNQSWVPVSAIINYPHNVSNNQIEVTKTVYDSYGPFSESVHQLSTSSSNSTRNRVTAILTYDICDLNWPLEKYDTAIFYSYDIHGNVNEMTQRISPSIIAAPQYPEGIIKKVNYEYDLISGNVNKVYYQKGNLFKDQFIHKYNYDADNRITSVETSRDGEIWEKDASYEYYEHGPLARVITGDKKVQGTDYAYTLQGWLKTVNSENLSTNTKDMGSDGNYVSKDAFGYSLSYFNNDYSARQPGTNNAHAVSSNSAVNQGTNLYNGNIKRMITSLRGLDEQIMPTQINLYSYDQLNRIFAMNSFKGIETSGELNLYNSYKSNYTYDKNGNLKTLHRDAPRLENNDDPNSEQIVSMDRFEYKYKPLTNKLRYIKDETDLTNLFEEDIDDQRPNNEPESNYNADNYKYDAIGQLISDKAENIEKISWRVDGKVKSIQKFSGEYFINFFYDGLGNRVAKQVSMGRAGTSSTHYTRDAQGNTMAVYDLRLNPERRAEYNLKEHHIYGSSRLGLQEYEIYKNPLNFHRLVGDKRYELSNHLGNVLNVISDRKIVNRKTKTILVDTFEDDLGWIAFNESDVFINKQRELQITIVPNENNLMSGALKKLKFQENETVMFNLEVKRENDLSAITPINFEIRDIYDKNVLWSSLVPANGIVSGSFTPTISNEYYVSITALPAAENEITFTVDNFYAYVLPPSPTDYVSLFQPDVLAYNDYYPFGSLVPNRHGSTADYRYGFQGQEKDDEIKGGEGNSLDFGERMYDPRIGRWFKIDPDDSKYPQFSPYLFASNNPIFLLDFDGRGPIIPKSWWQGKPQYAFFAGMVDEAWDTSKSLWDSAVELFWLSENTQEWEKRYGKIRREQYNAVVTIFNNEKARDALIIELYAKTGIYINTLAGGNGDDKAEYEKGKLAFQGLTAVIGLSEINAFIKTGSFTDDALKLIAKSGKYKPCGCFVSGTLVYTEEGYKNIEDIKVGDKVWAHDDVTENLALKKVIDTFTREFTQVYKIYFGDEVLEVTHEHPFFIGGKWLKVDELKKGNLLTLYDGTTKAISKIELVEGNFKVYNFTVDEFHTYYVSKQNVLVHNGNPCPWNKLKSESLTVVSYGYKHYVKNVKAAWKNIVSSTKNGPSKFKGSTEKVDDLIKTAWDNGKEVNNGKTWKVYEANDIIGAVSGKETKYMRVELTESTKEVHASPISEADYLKYTK